MTGSLLAITLCITSSALSLPVSENSQSKSRLSGEEDWQFLVEYCRQALPGNPEGDYIHFSVGLELFTQRKLSEAEVEFLTQLKLNPNHYRARLMLGIIALEQDRVGEAVQYLERALVGDQSLRQAYLPLGKAWFQLGNLQKARGALETAARVEPGVPLTYSLLASVYSRLGSKTEATKMSELYRTARKLKTAEVAIQLGDWAQSLQLVSDFLEAFPDSSRGLYVKGAIYFNGYRKAPEAVACLQHALSKNPANMEARRLAATIYLVAGDTQAFEREMKLLLTANPLDGLTHYYWGRYAFEKGRISEARHHLEQARQFRTADAQIVTNLAVVYEAQGLAKEAEQQHLAAISLAGKQSAPNSWVLYFNYGAFLLNAERPAEALKFLRIATSRPEPHPKALYLSGIANVRTGQLEEAVKQLEQAVVREPKYAEARAALAALYDRVGKTQEAAVERALIVGLEKAAKRPQSP